MTKNEIIELARQAWISDKEAQFITEFDEAYISCTYLQDLERFAALVASAEREACANVCETFDQREAFNDEDMAVADACATAIRGRGKA